MTIQPSQQNAINRIFIISIEEKKLIPELFEKEFKLSPKDAAGLFILSVHLVGYGVELRLNLGGFNKPNIGSFNAQF